MKKRYIAPETVTEEITSPQMIMATSIPLNGEYVTGDQAESKAENDLWEVWGE